MIQQAREVASEVHGETASSERGGESTNIHGRNATVFVLQVYTYGNDSTREPPTSFGRRRARHARLALRTKIPFAGLDDQLGFHLLGGLADGDV
uniref:Uncharacterized protein n=1 Tax=Arundo donax TaxID=35708 RepID=A0A0A8ZDC5_ARUDO